MTGWQGRTPDTHSEAEGAVELRTRKGARLTVLRRILPRAHGGSEREGSRVMPGCLPRGRVAGGLLSVTGSWGRAGWGVLAPRGHVQTLDPEETIWLDPGRGRHQCPGGVWPPGVGEK